MPNWKKLIVSGSDASLNSLDVIHASGSFSGSFQGDGSNLTGITVDAATTVEDSFTSQTSISITHNFETKNIIVSVYNNDDEQIIPETVTTTDNNTVDIVFSTSTSGRVVVVRGGHILSGSAATASLALELSNLATASFALTASHALNVPDTASHALTAVTSSIADELSQLATASFADNATSASYALYAVSASHEIVLETSSSFAETASLAINLSPEATASQADNATTASFAITASHALNVPATSSHALTAVSASIADELSQLATASHALTAVTASHALNVPNTASFALNADSASVAARATLLSVDATASFADLASDARTADSASVATRATELSADATASHALTAVTASHALTAVTSSIADELSGLATASFADLAGDARTADSASVAARATTLSADATASFADSATSSSYALTASVALNVPATASHADRATSASIADDIKDGAVTNAKLANDNITFGTTEQALGSTVSTLEGLDLISATTGTFVLQIYESSSTIITSGSNIFGNDQSDIQQITGSLKQSGSFTLSGSLLQSNGTISGSFEGDGSSLTGLTADSASVAARATTLSADATASHALTAVTASHTAGTASISNYATSASFAITASHLLGGAGNSGSFSGSFQGDGSELTGITVDSSTLVNATFTSQTSLTASHDLDSTNLIITVFNTDNEVLIPENIRILDNSNVGFDFATSTSGKYVLAKGGHIVSGSITTTVSEQTTVTASFVDQTSYTASHAFESKDVNVIIYGVNDELLIPQTIKTLNSSSVGVDFAESTSGRIVITKGGHFVSGSIVSASIADVATLARAGSGSFSGSFQGDGSNLTGVASPTGSFSGSFTGSMLISDHILPDTNEAYDIGSDSLKFRDLYLSGSTIYLGESKISINPIHGGIQVTDTQTGTPAQSLLSGSFTGSFSGSYIGDIEGTASIADLATTASHIVTASFADNATSSSIADELSQLATASFALTASHALNGGGGGDITEYTTVEDTFTGAISKQVTHNFGTKNVFVQTYYDDDTLFFPETITTTDTNTVDLTFSNPSTGRVIIGKSGHLVTASAAADSIAADSFTSQTSYTASHNFGTKEVVVQVYDNNDNVIVPSNIRAITDNAVGLDFASSRTGKVIISKGGHIVTGSVIATASVAEGLSPSAQRQNIILATNDLTGSVYSLHIISSSISMSAPPSPQPGDWFKVSQRVPSGSNFTSSLLFGNGSQIMSASTELELDVEDQGIEFIYADATQGWVIIGN